MYFNKIIQKKKSNKSSCYTTQINITAVSKTFFLANICGKYAPENFIDLLALYMERANCTVEALAGRTGVSDRTLSRMRTDPDYQFKLKTVVAICIALNLSEYESHKLIKYSGFQLKKGSRQHDAYAFLLCSCKNQEISVFQCNEKLVEWGFEELT